MTRFRPAPDQVAAFHEDGAVKLTGALDEPTLAQANTCFEWTLNHPGPGAGPVLIGTPGTFYQDQANPDAFPAYRELLLETHIPDIAATLFGCDGVWLMYEQIWLKDGADTRRTPWHQDLPYLPAGGAHMAVMWVNLDPVESSHSLEFIRGSHLGTLFNPSAFDPDDVSANLFDNNDWPPLPDIEAERDLHDIVSWATEPGDVIVFHPAVLHGGAPTIAGRRRRTLSLRFFGEDATCVDRPHDGMADVEGLKHDDGGRHPLKRAAKLPPGTPLGEAGFERLRPVTSD